MGCEAEPNVDADGEREPDDELPAIEPSPDAAVPDESPPPDAPVPDESPPPDAPFRDESPRPGHEEEDSEEEDEEDKPRSVTGPAGTASESTNTSPRMYSANWAGTPGWFAGWVNTTCNPVALTVCWPELVVPVSAPF